MRLSKSRVRACIVAKAAKISLRTFKTSFNGISDKGELPGRLKLFDWGENKSNKGRFIVDEKTFEVFGDNQRKLAREDVQVDFNHNSVEGTEAFKAAAGAPPLAGSGKPVCIKGQGIFLESVETSPTGLERARDYKDLSPAPLVDDETGRILALHSVALVPAGSVEGLTIESAALKALSASIQTLSVPNATLLTENTNGYPKAYGNADEPNKRMNDEMFTLIKKVMQMPEHCTYEDVMEKLKAHPNAKGRGGPLDHVNDTSNEIHQWEDGSAAEHANAGVKMLHELAAKIETKMGEKMVTLEAELTALKTKNDEAVKAAEKQEKDSIVADATKAGKVIPLSAEEILETPIKLLRGMISKLKPEVPLQSRAKLLSADEVKDRKITLTDSARLIDQQIAAAKSN